MFCPLQRPVDNTPGDRLGVWRDMRLADALVLEIYLVLFPAVTEFGRIAKSYCKTAFSDVVIYRASGNSRSET